MATINGVVTPSPGEESPLLGQEQMRRSVGVNGAGARLLGIPPSPREADTGRANQQVGKIRGLLIIISLWGLIFLQGESSERY